MHHHHLLQQRWALWFSLAALFQILLDFACYPDPCAYHAIPWIAAAIVIWASFAGRSLVARSFPALPHEWPAIVATTAFIFAAHADAGVSASISGASIRSITGLHLMRVVSCRSGFALCVAVAASHVAPKRNKVSVCRITHH